MADKTAFIYSDNYFKYDYGPHHPLRIERLKLTFDLIKAYQLLDLPGLMILEAEPAAPSDLECFHHAQYLHILRQADQGRLSPQDALEFGLGPGDNPIFTGMWAWSLLTTGASLRAGRLVGDGAVDLAFNPAGGLHHAMANRAGGFCYVNDVVITIKDLLGRGFRVAYVDVDAHHCDGVQEAFYDTDRVLTVSLHQHGRTLFPGTGHVYETGTGRGQGYSVNIPVYPGTDDDLFLKVFQDLVPGVIQAFQPDILVTQLGVDTFRSDPLTNLCLTNNGFSSMIRIFKDLNLPWVALGGGGYHIVNVARAWTLGWAIMNGVEPPDPLPDTFLEAIRPLGYREQTLRDAPHRTEGNRKEIETVARQTVDTLRRTCLNVIAGAGAASPHRT